jgi:hypothetical protein
VRGTMRASRAFLSALLLVGSVAVPALLAPTEAHAAKIATADGPAETHRDASDPYEDPDTTYHFIGLRYRHTLLPNFILSPFVDGGPTIVSVPSFGLDYAFRKGGTETIIGLSYADYSSGQFKFKGKSEDAQAYELVTSHLKMIQLTADFLWGTEFGNQFQFQYGLATGISYVFGDLNRVQSYPDSSGNYQPCIAPGDGPAKQNYCDATNDHYGNYVEGSWFDKGKRPSFYAIFGPEVALRFKPIHAVVVRADLGFNIFSGFFGGLGLSYGL